jgi:hypothetical protein
MRVWGREGDVGVREGGRGKIFLRDGMGGKGRVS